MSRFEELLRRIDAHMTALCSGNQYLWQWWSLASSPMTYVVLAMFFIVLYLAA